jgi:hypothetical protein
MCPRVAAEVTIIVGPVAGPNTNARKRRKTQRDEKFADFAGKSGNLAAV